MLFLLQWGHNVLRLFVILPIFSFATSERSIIISNQNGVYELHEFSCRVIFCMNSKVSLKYFVHDCLVECESFDRF